MPTQAYRIPNFLALLPSKPGGEISSHFSEADNGFNAWIHKKVGRLFAIVSICYLQLLVHGP